LFNKLLILNFKIKHSMQIKIFMFFSLKLAVYIKKYKRIELLRISVYLKYGKQIRKLK
jgi:hypothetical protein